MPLAGAGLQRQETHPISAIMSRDPNPLAFQLPADPARLKLEQPRLAKRFWRKLKHTASYLPGAETFLAAFYAAVDPKTPTTAKAVLFGALGYFIVPVDFIPDIFGAMGLWRRPRRDVRRGQGGGGQYQGRPSRARRRLAAQAAPRLASC
jgi:hypothetical protein